MASYISLTMPFLKLPSQRDVMTNMSAAASSLVASVRHPSKTNLSSRLLSFTYFSISSRSSPSPATKNIIDVAYLLDCISKDASKYVAKLKKQLEFKKGQYEINGNIGRAHLDIHQYTEIPPAAFQKEVTPEVFMDCIKVDAAKAKKEIPEDRIKAISVPTRTAEKVTLQPLSK